MRRIIWCFVMLCSAIFVHQPLVQAQQPSSQLIPSNSYALYLPLIARPEFSGWSLEPGWTLIPAAGHQLAHVVIGGPAVAYLTSPAYRLDGPTVEASILAKVVSVQGHAGLLFYIVWLPSHTESMGSLFTYSSDWQVASRRETAPIGTTGYELQIRGYADSPETSLDAWVDAPTASSR